MSIFEGITHSEEIQQLLTSVEMMYNDAKGRLESKRKGHHIV